MEVVLAKPAQGLHQTLQLGVGLCRAPGCLSDMIPSASSRGAWGKINTQRPIQTAEERRGPPVPGSPGTSSLHLLSNLETLPTPSLGIAGETGFSPEYTKTNQQQTKPTTTKKTPNVKINLKQSTQFVCIILPSKSYIIWWRKANNPPKNGPSLPSLESRNQLTLCFPTTRVRHCSFTFS